MSPAPRAPIFPPSPNQAPRTWLITSAAAPVGLALTRLLLGHGDNVVLGASNIEAMAASAAIARAVVTAEQASFGLPVAGMSAIAAGKAPAGMMPTPLKTPTPKGPSVARIISGTPSPDGAKRRAEEFARFVGDEVRNMGWEERCMVVELDGRNVGKCQAAIAHAVEKFGGVDVLFCCTSEAVVGTVEELAASERSINLVREQMDTNLFGPINIIKAMLPVMRQKKAGHIIALTGITSHLGTPGLGIFCASGWALEGFCDSLAYEVAPFGIKITIVQPSFEIAVLTNKISSAPAMPQYASSSHPAPLTRAILGRLLDRIEMASDPPLEASSTTASSASSANKANESTTSQHAALSSTTHVSTVFPNLPSEMQEVLLAETVHAVAAIGGHENPPARHIVGFEAVASVKEKLKTVSEELEDFVGVSGAVDVEVRNGG